MTTNEEGRSGWVTDRTEGWWVDELLAHQLKSEEGNDMGMFGWQRSEHEGRKGDGDILGVYWKRRRRLVEIKRN